VTRERRECAERGPGGDDGAEVPKCVVEGGQLAAVAGVGDLSNEQRARAVGDVAAEANEEST
jgi:hypothetical protein